ncbi:MAG TPA: hypothetical protein ENH94_03160, partial [Phycisphaerales bacterium]|nr:hypothetical protein [Phycisphaerales bacterium]
MAKARDMMLRRAEMMKQMSPDKCNTFSRISVFTISKCEIEVPGEGGSIRQLLGGLNIKIVFGGGEISETAKCTVKKDAGIEEEVKMLRFTLNDVLS